MFDINAFFENFSKNKGYERLAERLKDASEMIHNGKFIKVKNMNIPELEFKPELDEFSTELEKEGWEKPDISMFETGLRLYKSKPLENDLDAFFVCMLCKDLFPEKTELFDMIRDDLINGHRNPMNYVDLFDLESPEVLSLLIYMS